MTPTMQLMVHELAHGITGSFQPQQDGQFAITNEGASICTWHRRAHENDIMRLATVCAGPMVDLFCKGLVESTDFTSDIRGALHRFLAVNDDGTLDSDAARWLRLCAQLCDDDIEQAVAIGLKGASLAMAAAVKSPNCVLRLCDKLDNLDHKSCIVIGDGGIRAMVAGEIPVFAVLRLNEWLIQSPKEVAEMELETVRIIAEMHQRGEFKDGQFTPAGIARLDLNQAGQRRAAS